MAMHDNDSVSVVIVDWRSNKLLKNCLNSVFLQTYRNFEIILVENEPLDSFLREILSSFPQLRIIANKKNFFYSFAQNQGIKEAKGEFVLSLNNDIILDRNFLKEVLNTIKMDRKIGIVSGKILSYKGEFIDSTGQFLSRMRKPLERGHREKDIGQFDTPGFVFGACGACAFYRKEMLEAIRIEDGEYFDNNYGLFYEDLDLNWRAQLAGWKAYYNPKAIGYHLRGSSAKVNQPKFRIFKRFEFCYLLPEHKLMLLKNRYATIIKNETTQGFLRNFFFIFIYDLSIWAYLLLFEPSIILRFRKEVKYLLSVFRKERR
ncbi:MAG: glycosyltransferase family 2 protein [Candidatus Omnitrophica bacterium]|nr:glycosyltransferase family 2 protein [Candidatus Omnitrophota bacterium]